MIYLLEDDDNIRKFVVYALNNSGFQAEGFERPSLFWAAIEQILPELVLLDIMLPEEDGLETLKKLRAGSRTRNLPVIMLTAKDSEYDKVIGLDLGADDYMVKPFGTLELTSRVRALLRRTDKRERRDEFCFGPLFVSPQARIVRAEGKDISLTRKEFELLCLLIENDGMVFTRDRLLETIWGYEFDGENRTVDVHIRTLRAKLGSCGDMIETVRGIGYKFGGTR